MKIRYYFFLLALIIVGVFAALMWLTFSIRPVIFYVAEGVLVRTATGIYRRCQTTVVFMPTL